MRKKGLTIVEIIFSIAILIIISAIAIRAFVSSGELNYKAGRLDDAVFASVRILELCPIEAVRLDEESLFKYAKIDEIDGGYVAYALLDKDFNPIDFKFDEFNIKNYKLKNKNVLIEFVVDDCQEYWNLNVKFFEGNMNEFYSVDLDVYKSVMKTFNFRGGNED